jgi:hypothetical protein
LFDIVVPHHYQSRYPGQPINQNAKQKEIEAFVVDKIKPPTQMEVPSSAKRDLQHGSPADWTSKKKKAGSRDPACVLMVCGMRDVAARRFVWGGEKNVTKTAQDRELAEWGKQSVRAKVAVLSPPPCLSPCLGC